ncbi:MAG TPA: MBL fold metallo-hydrolase [Candidatus Baltobacteraceae bacterium]|nr:MBL fold metallo-hydrolase [Candidatus Baltobacteraceae bacterium]
MKIQFLGAAGTVTGSQYLLTTDRARLVIDCGMFQGSPEEAARNRAGFAYDPATIDAVLLTHAHLDHCGLLPALVKGGFGGPIITTRGTQELAELVLLDSGKLQIEQAQAHNERLARETRREAREAAAGSAGSPAPPSPGPVVPTGRATAVVPVPHRASDHGPFPRGGGDPERPAWDEGPIEPLYDQADAAAAMQQFRGIDYDAPIDVAPGVRATFHDAGHILGSAIIVVEVTEAASTSSRRIVFSGDLGRPDAPIIRDPTAILEGADYVLVESTYGGREHEPEDEAVRLLAAAVQATADHTGVLLIPAFAIGRTQDMLWVLDRLLETGRIPHLPLYLDSPMASKATAIYLRHPEYYDAETRQLITAGDRPLQYPGEVNTDTADESKRIRLAPRPMMIVSASGMLTGGRIVHHLDDLIDDPKAILLFVGYQGEGTLGAHLQAGATQVRLNGVWRDVRCEIRSISGFSAHADEDELAAWLAHFAGVSRQPRTIFIVHGDPDAELAVEARVKGLGLTAYRPAWREEVDLG